MAMEEYEKGDPGGMNLHIALPLILNTMFYAMEPLTLFLEMQYAVPLSFKRF